MDPNKPLYQNMSLSLLLFSLLFSLSNQLSFNYTSVDSTDTTITYERAYVSNSRIQLTRGTAVIARATYSFPLPLYFPNKTLTDFETRFKFVIDTGNKTLYGDGIAFFLAPEGSRIPEGVTKGGTLGLASDQQVLNSTDNPFVGVEFDIYRNAFDSNNHHVGIDVNSLRSVANESWENDPGEGRVSEAWVRYDSASKNLSVVFTGFQGNVTVYQGLYYIIDLRNYLPELVTFGFSAATGNNSATQSILSWSFSSTLQIDSKNRTHSSKKWGLGLVIGLVAGGSVFVCVLCLILFLFWRKKKRGKGYDDDNPDIDMNDEFERGGPKRFSYRELAKITGNFDVRNKLGEGGFGGVYKGFSKKLNINVAVKRVSSESRQGKKEYASEVTIISRLRHRNLVQLLGWCHEKKELLLVYEHMSNGSLDHHLFNEKSLLTWPVRYQIAQGLASALLYLHEEWEQCILHRDIKPSNVMLDSNFNAKLGDFGLARLVDHEKGSQTTIVAGTRGYMAPEYVVKGKATKETDIYSFGVVALEIACGRKPINHQAKENEISLVEWVWELHGMGRMLDAVDIKLCDKFNKDEIERLMIVGLWCAHPDNRVRPLIREVVRVLNCEMGVPILPLEVPLVNYNVGSRISRRGTLLSDNYDTILSEQSSVSAISKTNQTLSSEVSTTNHTLSSDVSTTNHTLSSDVSTTF